MQLRLAHCAPPCVGLVRHAVLAPRVHHGKQHLQFVALDGCFVCALHHALGEQRPVLGVARGVYRSKIRANPFPLGFFQLVAVHQRLLKVWADCVHLHHETCVAPALNVHRSHQKPCPLRYHVAGHAVVLAHLPAVL